MKIFQRKEVPKISEPRKFKSVPFQIPELSSKQKKNILTLPADKGSKLELLQKVCLYLNFIILVSHCDRRTRLSGLKVWLFPIILKLSCHTYSSRRLTCLSRNIKERKNLISVDVTLLSGWGTTRGSTPSATSRRAAPRPNQVRRRWRRMRRVARTSPPQHPELTVKVLYLHRFIAFLWLEFWLCRVKLSGTNMEFVLLR